MFGEGACYGVEVFFGEAAIVHSCGEFLADIAAFVEVDGV